MDTNEEYRFISAPYVIDRKLYKYYSNAKYAIDCIKNRRIHLDDPQKFNDPFDAAFNCPEMSILTSVDSNRELSQEFLKYLYAVKKEDQEIHYQEILKNYIEFLIKSSEKLSTKPIERPVKYAIQEIYYLMNTKAFSLDEFIDAIDQGFVEHKRIMRLKCRISCFSEIYDSILMWSYYANSHKGICIEFDLSLLDQKAELTQKILNAISKVHYSPVRADLQYSVIRPSELNFLMSKADVWGHEHEWRLICENDTEYLPFDCISGVYIGVNFDTSSAKYKDLVKAVNTYDSLTIKQCKLSLERYRIESEEIYNSYVNKFLSRSKKSGCSEKIVSMDCMSTIAT